MTTFVPEAVPAILAGSREEALAKWAAVAEAPLVQVDCLDGSFVPNHSFHEAPSWPTAGPAIELHLMCSQPLRVMETWQAHPRLERIVWHVEAPADHHRLIAWCRQRGFACGLALNPETPLVTVARYAAAIDLLLLLSVHPGWSGQPFLPTTFAKLKDAHARWPELPIGLDGGLTEALLPELASLGASVFYLSSEVFGAERPADALHRLQKIAHDGHA